MTSASELFCSRRTRIGRVSADLELESGPELSYGQHHHQQSSRRHRFDRRSGGDSYRSSRRTSLSRMPGHGTAFAEREPIEVNEGASEYGPENYIIAGVSSSSNRSRVACSERLPGAVLQTRERLPGAVLQARERLMQRLRGAAVSDRRSSLNVSQRNNTFNDEFRLVDAVDWETDTFPGLSHRGNSSSSSVFHSETDPLLLTHSKKPPGLSQEALDCLPSEIFNGADCSCANKATDDNSTSYDCSICLERFSSGNKLICLPCSHRFHLACLSQWARICGDCPCCRSSVS